MDALLQDSLVQSVAGNIQHAAKSEITVNATVFVACSALIGVLFALYQFAQVRKVRLENRTILSVTSYQAIDDHESRVGIFDASRLEKITFVYDAIRKGADGFLYAEYTRCLLFMVFFGTIVFFATSRVRENCTGVNQDECEVAWVWKKGGLTTASFVVGALTSIMCGFLGMKVAVFSNARTTISCADPDSPYERGFNTSFTAGSVVGVGLVSIVLTSLYVLLVVYNKFYPFGESQNLSECATGFGLGASAMALFGRVGGGIFTKAADVGADLAGKVVNGIPEDDARNPGVIADNVGDNVGDVAGMGSDVIGSLAESTCAALVLAHASSGLVASGWTALVFPMIVTAVGILVSIVVAVLPLYMRWVKREQDIERQLKVQLFLTAALITAALYPVAHWALPEEFDIETVRGSGHIIKGNPTKAYLCAVAGLWAGNIIGFWTEYYTSFSYTPTVEVAQSAETGAATLIIYGLALGFKSCTLPVFLIAGVVYVSFTSLDMYGVSLGAIGMLGNLATALAIDVFGPIADNAGGIAEMSHLAEGVRKVTDSLDAAGNTTAAVGKGFAIGSACLVGLALFGAFIKRCGLNAQDVSVLNPVIFSFVLIGAMLPYWFSAMTMKSVGTAAKAMVIEIKRQFDTIEGLLDGTPGHAPAEYAKCVQIATDAALREMIPPGILVMFTPIITGVLFGSSAVAGLLAGVISSAIQLALAMSNAGGAWDNAKKFVEKGGIVYRGEVTKKGSEYHKATVVGDTVGDPFKDTSGPSLNILIKLMCVLSLVFADFFMSINNGKGLIHWEEP